MKNCVEQLRGLVTRHLTSDHQWPSDRNWRAEFGAFSGFSPHHLSTVWLDRTVTICTNTQKPSFPRNRSQSTSPHPPNFTCLCNFKERTGWTHNCAISIYPSPISAGAHRINIRTLRLQSKCHHYNDSCQCAWILWRQGGSLLALYVNIHPQQPLLQCVLKN